MPPDAPRRQVIKARTGGWLKGRLRICLGGTLWIRLDRRPRPGCITVREILRSLLGLAGAIPQDQPGPPRTGARSSASAPASSSLTRGWAALPQRRRRSPSAFPKSSSRVSRTRAPGNGWRGCSGGAMRAQNGAARRMRHDRESPSGRDKRDIPGNIPPEGCTQSAAARSTRGSDRPRQTAPQPKDRPMIEHRNSAFNDALR
jgi:hypothetical protein